MSSRNEIVRPNKATRGKRANTPLRLQLSSLRPIRRPFETESTRAIRKANELWNTEIARLNTCMDFLFIALYWGVFFLLARLQSRWAFVLVALFISLAGAFDIAENVRLLQALHGVILGESQFPVPGFVSEVKWVLFAIATCILGIALAVSKKLWAIVMAILTSRQGPVGTPSFDRA